MASARDLVKAKYPEAHVVRSMFGLIVVVDEAGTRKLGNGRAYWDEEAWIEAAEEL